MWRSRCSFILVLSLCALRGTLVNSEGTTPEPWSGRRSGRFEGSPIENMNADRGRLALAVRKNQPSVNGQDINQPTTRKGSHESPFSESDRESDHESDYKSESDKEMFPQEVSSTRKEFKASTSTTSPPKKPRREGSSTPSSTTVLSYSSRSTSYTRRRTSTTASPIPSPTPSAPENINPIIRETGLGGPQPNRGANNKHVPKNVTKPSPFAESVKCGGNVTLTSMPTVIRSPGWEQLVKYPSNADCSWTVLTMDSGERTSSLIRFKIRHLDIEEDVECKYDFLEIKGHNKKLCGLISNKEHLINATTFDLHFKTDSNYEGKGFEVELSVEVEGCTSLIVAQGMGVISSPLYPKNYPDSTDCWTLMQTKPEEMGENITITLNFEVVDMEPDAKCTYDWIEVFDGMDAETKSPGKLLGKFCEFNVVTENEGDDVSLDSRTSGSGDKATLSVRSSGRDILLHFHSDQLLNSRGYRATYIVDTLERSTGTNCIWAPDALSLTIASPSFPKDYPPNIDCTITLTAPSSEHKIAVIFDSFHMEIDPNCTFDRLEIYDDIVKSDSQDSTNARRSSGGITTYIDRRLPLTEPARTLCGRKTSKFKFLSNGPQIKMRFVSDNFAEYPGFSAHYTFIKGNSNPVSHPFTPVIVENHFEVAPENATIVTGSSHLLSCQPKHRSEEANNETVLWFKDDTLITEGVHEEGTKLLIREFTTSSAGRYTCKFGDHQKEAWLSSRAPSCSLIFRKRPLDLLQSEGEFLTTLECNAVTPLGKRVLISWEKDGHPIGKNSSKRIEQLRNGYLIISGIQKKDTGYYFCIARVEEQPNCRLRAAARIDVNVRVNVDKVCGQPVLGHPSKQKPTLDSFGKIVGGQDAQKGAFPWQVMFWDYRRRSFCGGALLNERWVATAAHCFETNPLNPPPPPQSNIEVRLGKYDQSVLEEENQVTTKIEDVIKHPDFDRKTFDNDLALVKLTDHVHFTKFVQPICLGKDQEVVEETFFRHHSLRMGHVTGWGQLKENGPQPKFLQELRMPIVAQNTCKNSTTFNVTHNMFCAGYAQEIIGDACKGDSGGPFVSQDANRWHLLGIVSWGEGCGRTGKYGFYTKVNNYIDWIKAFIKL